MRRSFWHKVHLCFGIYSIVLFSSPANGFASFSPDPCPAYVRPGEKWFIESSCIMCQCDIGHQGYSCFGNMETGNSQLPSHHGETENVKEKTVKRNNLIENILRDLFSCIVKGDRKKTMSLVDKLGRLVQKQTDCKNKLIPEKDDISVIHLAAIHFTEDSEVIEKLVSINPELLNLQRTGQYEGQTPLHIAISNKNDKAIKSILQMAKRNDQLKEILQAEAKGTYFENTVMMGSLPLSVAVLTFNMDVVKTLVKDGACLHAKNHKGNTVFHSLVHFAAVFPDRIDHVTKIMKDLHKYMIEKPLEKHSRSMDVWYEEDKDGLTVLQLSVKLAQPEIFKTLLELKAIYHYEDKQDGLFDSKMYDITEIDTVALQEWRAKTAECHNAISPMICGTEDKNSTVTSYGKKNCFCQTKSVEPAPRKGFLKKRWPSVVELVCENKQVLKIFEILDVDVVRLVVEKKWHKVKNWFISWFIFHLAFMISLSVYTVYKAEYYRECGGMVTGTAGSNSTCVYSNEKRDFLLVCAGLIIAYSLVHLLMEARRYFWYSQPIGFKLIHHNGFYRLLLVGCFSLLIADSLWFYARHPHNNILVVLALILGWWYMTFFLRPLKKFSFFAVMLRKVLIGDILRFIIIIFLELIAFSLAMYIIFLPSPDGPPEAFDGWVTVMTMFQVLLGLTDLNILDTLRASSVPWLSITLFVFFIILTSIMMLNALIAMMSNTCTLVAENRKKQTELQKLSVALYMESMIPFKKFVISDIKEVQRGYSYPNPTNLREGRSYLKVKTLQKFTDESRMSTSKIKEIFQTVVNKEITQFKDTNQNENLLRFKQLAEDISKLSITLGESFRPSELPLLQFQNDSANERNSSKQAADLQNTQPEILNVFPHSRDH